MGDLDALEAGGNSMKKRSRHTPGYANSKAERCAAGGGETGKARLVRFPAMETQVEKTRAWDLIDKTERHAQDLPASLHLGLLVSF